MNLQDFIAKTRREFDLMIAQKPSWDKNEIMQTFDLAVFKISFNELSKELESDK